METVSYRIKVKFDEYKNLAYAKRSLSELYSRGFIEKVADGTVDTIMAKNPMLSNEYRDKAISDVKYMLGNIRSKYQGKCNEVYNTYGYDVDNKTFAEKSKEMFPDEFGMLMLMHIGEKKAWKVDYHITKQTVAYYKDNVVTEE